MQSAQKIHMLEKIVSELWNQNLEKIDGIECEVNICDTAMGFSLTDTF